MIYPRKSNYTAFAGLHAASLNLPANMNPAFWKDTSKSCGLGKKTRTIGVVQVAVDKKSGLRKRVSGASKGSI